MATETEPATTESLTDAEKGSIVFNFIQNTSNGLAARPEFVQALIRDFFNPNAQQSPRHYSLGVYRDRYLYAINPFVGHFRQDGSNHHNSLEIGKYDPKIEDYDKSLLGKIHISSSWTEVDGDKNFTSGGAHYYDNGEFKWPGTNDLQLAMSKGRILIATLISPVNF